MQTAPPPAGVRHTRTVSSPYMTCIVTYCAHMADQDDGLDSLSSKELHDLAIHRARRHLDAKFFWNLMSVLPAAEAAAGETGEAASDIDHLSAHLDDVTESGEGETADLLRPFYLDYLRSHGVKAPS